MATRSQSVRLCSAGEPSSLSPRRSTGSARRATTDDARHRHLKLYVATHGVDFGMSTAATAMVEHRFRTGDRVDVMFHNHEPERTVVEIEIAGEDNICTGIHQAIKYRSLAQVEGGYDHQGSTVRSLVVAYDTQYAAALSLAERYEVGLVSVDSRDVLATAI